MRKAVVPNMMIYVRIEMSMDEMMSIFRTVTRKSETVEI